MKNLQSSDKRLEDTKLWVAFKKGDRSAYEQIYQTYIRVLLVYGVRILENEETVRDTIQDLFIELWKSRETISTTDNIKVYLFQALRYKLLKERTKTGNEDLDIALTNYQSLLKVYPHESFLIEEEHRSEQMRKLQRAMSNLPPRQHEVLHLRYFQDCSNEDIARIMGIQYQSVSNLIHKSLEFLKHHFHEILLILGIALLF